MSNQPPGTPLTNADLTIEDEEEFVGMDESIPVDGIHGGPVMYFMTVFDHELIAEVLAEPEGGYLLKHPVRIFIAEHKDPATGKTIVGPRFVPWVRFTSETELFLHASDIAVIAKPFIGLAAAYNQMVAQMEQTLTEVVPIVPASAPANNKIPPPDAIVDTIVGMVLDRLKGIGERPAAPPIATPPAAEPVAEPEPEQDEKTKMREKFLKRWKPDNPNKQ